MVANNDDIGFKADSSSRRKRSRPVTKKGIFEKNKLIIPSLVLLFIILIFVTVFMFLNQSDDITDSINSNNPFAIIDTTMGEIKVELFKDKVPNTVNNFIKLANDGFYEGLVFHRVIDDFMIQGGGFNEDGTPKQSPYGTIDLEISNDVRHIDGAIAMARTSDPNSATSQFYICDGKQSFLDDNYATFGLTIEGLDVVRSIAEVDTTTKNGMDDWPVNEIIINSIIIENY